MKVIHCGIQTPHAPGIFGKRMVDANWFLACFQTDFVYEKEGTFLPGKAGDFLIVPPGIPVCQGPAGKTQSFTNDWIYLQCDELTALLEKYPLPLLQPFSAGLDGTFRRYVETARKEKQSGLAGSEDLLLCLTGRLIIELHRAVQQRTRDASRRLETVRRAVLLEPEKPWTLESMAELGGYSVSRFAALYRETFGVSPKQELLQARLEKAEGLLQYAGSSVSQVAEACGFSSIHWFSKYFKATRGVSPSRFAKTAIDFASVK